MLSLYMYIVKQKQNKSSRIFKIFKNRIFLEANFRKSINLPWGLARSHKNLGPIGLLICDNHSGRGFIVEKLTPRRGGFTSICRRSIRLFRKYIGSRVPGRKTLFNYFKMFEKNSKHFQRSLTN